MKKKILANSIATAICLSMAACGSNNEFPNPTQKQTETRTETQKTTEISTSEVTEPTPTPQVSQGQYEVKESDNEFSYNHYYSFMLDNANGNGIFSPESMNSAICLYSELLTNEDKNTFKEYLHNKDYLSYQNSNSFKTINRLWVNENKDFDANVVDIIKKNNIQYKLNMNDSNKATQEKNDYVAQNTNNFITSTPTVFDADTVFDVMNITYFKDSWMDGDKTMSSTPYTFHNDDGTEVDIPMMMDNDGIVKYTDNAHSYTMYYNDGFTFTVILPDAGYSLEDIDLDDFINGNVAYYDCISSLYIPEFETETTYFANTGNFGLTDGELNPDIYNKKVDKAQISQVAKIKFDREGTEAAAVSEIVVTDSISMDEPPLYEVVCDKPFAYYITDTTNNDIAFIGFIKNMN